MVVKHTMAAGKPPAVTYRKAFDDSDSEVWMYGTRVYPKPGETCGEAYQRQLKQDAAKNAAASKLAAQKADDARKIAELRRMEGEVAKAERELALKAQHDQLAAEVTRLEQQLDERSKPKPRKGIRFGQPFNVGKSPRPAA